MNDIERIRFFQEIASASMADLEHRLKEVQDAIDRNLPNAERFHVERYAIRYILKMRKDKDKRVIAMNVDIPVQRGKEETVS